MVARYGQEVVHHVTLHAVGRQLCLVGHFRVVFVEVFREVDDRLLDEFEVARSAHDDADVDRFVGLDGLFVYLSGDVETSHAAREVVGFLWQRVYLYGESRSLDAAFHFDIAATAVEERLEGVYIAVLLYDGTVEGDARNLQLSRHLRVHHVLAPRHAAVVASVDILYMERLLLRQFHLLRVESGEVGHLSFQLCQVDEGVHLVGQEDGFLFVDASFVGAHLDEEVVAADGRPSLAHLVVVVIVVVHLRSGTVVRCMSADGHLRGVRRDGLPLHLNMSCGDGERTVLHGTYNKGIGDRRRAAGVSVDHRVARLLRRVRPRDELQPFGQVADAEVLRVLCVQRISQAEVFTVLHMRGCIDGERLCRHDHGGEHHLTDE